jgi:hypothetical protein
MTTKENPAPRANAGSRANSKVEQLQIIASPVDWKADAAAGWLARHLAAPIATSAHSRLPALHGELDEAAP